MAPSLPKNVMGGDEVPSSGLLSISPLGLVPVSGGRVAKSKAYGKPANFQFALNINSCVKEWVKCPESDETKLADYLGLVLIAELRFLAISWPVLDILTVFHPLRGDTEKTHSFEIMHSPITRERIKAIVNPEREWPMGDEWDNSNEIIRSKRMAWCLLHLPMYFDIYQAQSSAERKAKNLESRENFKAKFGLVCTKQDDLQFDSTFPQFGPSRMDGKQEHLNRAWELLKYVSYLIDSDWHDRKVFSLDKGLSTYTEDIHEWIENITLASLESQSQKASAY
ncbi:hypothetical protein PENANT_c005G03681 [Penicillium antarcticum]|uniref:Uncharacterized protein n=1 Tax=Penicillium antarcticum TaxID=416450 RepID=A0A1V6QF43_9EURO|nr:Helicase C-terminal [Penicillium antarcticum]KAJ5297495.1 Helicase C-terminal [Penicillium antarcticum]OQD87824.1 hypothetical protein PENANT_c005G03681 [Penicillium antarcticum]